MKVNDKAVKMSSSESENEDENSKISTNSQNFVDYLPSMAPREGQTDPGPLILYQNPDVII